MTNEQFTKLEAQLASALRGIAELRTGMAVLTKPRPQKLLTIEDVAECFGVSVKTIRRWKERKKLAFVQLSARCIRFRQSDIEKEIERRTIPAL